MKAVLRVDLDQDNPGTLSQMQVLGPSQELSQDC